MSIGRLEEKLQLTGYFLDFFGKKSGAFSSCI